ncbi:FKBP-type peptidyl-prolyl cis-trans isomerase [methanogenic archaeon mixed culture ISO4-G1]|nr:FKBP-type peptidyl-prolyl cis-trans isomerase [methanogenic archaeon mixed culture ISO4-G1]
MRIGVTYENGEIFQHFGRTQQFKIYEVEDKKILSSRVIGNNGLSHGALGTILQDEKVDVFICGGIGGGARQMIVSHGIELVAGAEGDADEVVQKYLGGTLVCGDSECHHDHECHCH